MDKGLGTLYHKLTNFFHTNNSTSSSSNVPSANEIGTSLPISTFFDRLIPSSATSATTTHQNERRHNTSRISRQISIKTNDNQCSPQTFPSYIQQKTTSIKIPKQQQQHVVDEERTKNPEPTSSIPGMDDEEFRRRGKEMIDYIADYLLHISDRRVTPEVEPGYLRPMLPKNAPEKSEKWENIMQDVEQAIMPGITHWQHPRFHAYFPAGNSYPSILGEMLSSGLGIVGFSWAASPACTELETIMLDWIGRMIDLPVAFLPFDPNHDYEESDNESSSQTDEDDDINEDHLLNSVKNDDEQKQAEHIGGGVILGSASECILVAMLAARTKKITSKRLTDPLIEDGQILARLVCYTSKLAHSCVEKAGLIAMVRVRQLAVDEHFSLRGKTLEECIRADKEKGLIPFLVSGTLGTTSCCSYDNLKEIGEICQREQLWFHVDGAYAGSAFICEEFRYIMKGLEYADSFNTNPNKWLLMNFDCSCFWVRDKFALINAMSVDPLYLQHKHAQQAVDYRHWGVALSRRFRSLKLWFTIRSYGIEGLRHYIREHCRLAKVFELLISTDCRFDIIGDVTLGLVCFRLKGSNKLSQKLLLSLNDSGRIHMVPSMVNDLYIIRFAVCAKHATDDDMHVAFHIIQEHADSVIAEHRAQRNGRQSASVDSLESAIKQASITNLDQDITVSEEVINPEPSLTETIFYPITKVRSNTITTMTPHHRVTFEKPISNLLRDKRPRPMFVRMVSDAKLYYPKRNASQLSRQTSLVSARMRKRIQSESGNHAATRSSSERYLSRTVSILETVNSDEGELEDIKS
ncbi:unnamed protein product [Adineta steineri]|uniref:Uncharacterized protein n=1 Tax=Adineta steineri TaxID=433720 RepID=A0A813ZEV8_9BILA|nr:unnamed protein product [Adineta steineri]CAF0904816.1 unnamed protein product [Adineta steineri]CAF3506056.1 unnamed protein product [Adineta steineri]CAF3698596.1 unnamed protein product [Adineta steineri]